MKVKTLRTPVTAGNIANKAKDRGQGLTHEVEPEIYYTPFG